MKMSGARRVIFDCASHRADRRCFRGSPLGGLAGQGWGALAMSGRLANANHVVPRGRCGCNAHARHQGQAGLASPSCMRCMAGWRRLRGQLQPSRGGRGSARPGRPVTRRDSRAPSLHRAGCRFSGRAKAQSGCGAPTWRPRACPPRAVRSVRARFPGPHVAIALASGARHATGTSRGRQSARKVGTRMQGRGAARPQWRTAALARAALALPLRTRHRTRR